MEHHSEGSVSSDTHKRKKCCNRHTSNQIQRLEAVFKTCSYPDEKQRLQLGRELAMDPTKIKFWFQNRRTQLKTQNERDDNCTLIQENDKIRSQNKAMREALQNVICSTCDGQKLRIENARLKEELVRVSSIAAGYTGSSSTLPNVPYQPAGLSHKEKSLMFDIATNAMQELIFLMETNEPLWMKSNNNGRDTLNLETYETMFPRTNNQLKNPNIRIEASRKSGDVIMNALTLVEMFMDPIDFVEQHKWMELFPTIVTIAKTIEVISSRTKDGLDGSLQLSNVLSNGNDVQEVVHIANVSRPGNCISVFKGFSTGNNNMLILQESCVDSSGSLVVSCPIDSSIMSEADPSYIQLLPSGFIITSDGKQNENNIQGGNSGNDDVASTSSNTNIGGSLLTVAFQIMVNSLPSKMESVPVVNGLICKTVEQIKAALNCPM
ncbi:homeobox leucine zipper protein [Medicago truncatula]|uniref:Homeobox leucine zipper protein n=1 Tax=Medicago truncatula TaxID=3880 RepID=A0A072TWZ9_MEDTR|nr:homeobox leucine zipper protein [Medicago truncatula]